MPTCLCAHACRVMVAMMRSSCVARGVLICCDARGWRAISPITGIDARTMKSPPRCGEVRARFTRGWPTQRVCVRVRVWWGGASVVVLAVAAAAAAVVVCGWGWCVRVCARVCVCVWCGAVVAR